MSSSEAVSPRRVFLLLALLAGAVLLYAPTLSHPPIWDDHTFVFGQPFLRDCRNLGKVLSPKSFRGVLPVRGSARPVWLASVLADTCLGGGRLWAYRLTSAFWHGVGALLLAFLAWRLSRDAPTALMAGVLFTVHPLHVETVSIITFRADLLCLAFMLASVILHRESRLCAGRAGTAFLAAALGAAVLALLSKETAVVLPPLLLLTEILFPATGAWRAAGARRRTLWAGAAACAVLVGGYLLFRAPRSGYVMRHSRDFFSELRLSAEFPFSRPLEDPARSGRPEVLDDPPWQRVYVDAGARARTMSRVFGSYLRRFVWPHPLQGDYAPVVVESWLHPGVLAAEFGWLLLFAGAWALRRRLPLASYGALWTAVTLLPVSGIVLMMNLEADRYLYIPSAGACLAAAALLGEGMRRGKTRARAAAAAFVLAAAAGAVLVVRRGADFHSDEAFYRATLAVDPGVSRARLALAMVCANQENFSCAEEECRRSLRLWPGSRKARTFCSVFLRPRVPEKPGQ